MHICQECHWYRAMPWPFSDRCKNPEAELQAGRFIKPQNTTCEEVRRNPLFPHSSLYEYRSKCGFYTDKRTEK